MPASRFGRRRTLPTRFWVACLAALCLGIALRSATDTFASRADDGLPHLGHRLADALEAPQRQRTPVSYRGLGVWIDAFDFDPMYQGPAADPAITPDEVEEFAELGVRTIYLQAARRDDRSGPGVLNEQLLGEFLLQAHRYGLHVVAWYLPLFDSVDSDLAKVQAMADFDVDGHRFDGVALDIEYISGVPDAAARSAALIDLVERTDEANPDEAFGAIVPPAVQLEVVNPRFWPDFPWAELDPHIDVWLPMAYWTTRSASSGYRDAYRYSEESVRRMINNLGRDVTVHLIGGIGDQTSPDDLSDFRDAVDRTGAVGASIYDWNSMSDDLRIRLPTIVR